PMSLLNQHLEGRRKDCASVGNNERLDSMRTKERLCPICQRSFETTRPNRTFCSKQCKRTSETRKKRAARLAKNNNHSHRWICGDCGASAKLPGRPSTDAQSRAKSLSVEAT